MKRFFWLIYIQPLYIIIAAAVVMVLLWGYLGSKRYSFWRSVNLVLLAGSVAAILYLTLFTRDSETNGVFLIPFHSFQQAQAQPEIYRSMLMNVFLFVPFGLSMPAVISKTPCPVLITIALAAVLSAAVEYAQYRFGLGSCEIDDVIMNTLGAAIGTAAFRRPSVNK